MKYFSLHKSLLGTFLLVAHLSCYGVHQEGVQLPPRVGPSRLAESVSNLSEAGLESSSQATTPRELLRRMLEGGKGALKHEWAAAKFATDVVREQIGDSSKLEKLYDDPAGSRIIAGVAAGYAVHFFMSSDRRLIDPLHILNSLFGVLIGYGYDIGKPLPDGVQGADGTPASFPMLKEASSNFVLMLLVNFIIKSARKQPFQGWKEIVKTTIRSAMKHTAGHCAGYYGYKWSGAFVSGNDASSVNSAETDGSWTNMG